MMHINNLNNGNRPQGSLYTACIGLFWLNNKVAQSCQYFKKKIFLILNIGTPFFKYDFKGFVVLAIHDKHIEPG
jgi:hypothetical protein